VSEHPREERSPSEPSPELIMRLGTSFMATKHLIAASEAGIFEALGDGALSLEELAQRTGIPQRTARISADAMVALGLLERDGARYRNTEVAERFLSGRHDGDLRPFLRLVNLNYGVWADFSTAIRTGRGPGFITQLDPEGQHIFSEGVQAVTAGAARALTEAYEFDRHQRLLDLGGGTGSFLRVILDRHPGLECGLFELPAVVALAREHLSGRIPAGRIEFFEGDLLSDALPGGYDALLLANVVHVFSPEQNRGLFTRAHESTAPGARLLLVDFWTDPTHTQPLFAALMAGEFLMAGGEGDVYSEDEGREMLDATGWVLVERRQLAGPASLIVAERS
jgi:hypothetical protein